MSIIEHCNSRIRHFIINNFSLSPYGYKLRTLKNIHANRRCFIIGNGPSLKATDLDVLDKNNEITFAFNRIYHIFEQTNWRPTYYVSQDQLMARNTYQEMCAVPAVKRFFPIELKWWNHIPIHDAVFFHLSNPDDFCKPIFNTDIDKFIGNSPTVVFTAMQLAAYMGITEIYLLGVDQHFRTSRNSNGEIVVDVTAKDYFSDKYNEDKAELPIPSTEISLYSFISAKNYCDKHGIRIFNATRGGKLEVYPRVNFDGLFTSR